MNSAQGCNTGSYAGSHGALPQLTSMLKRRRASPPIGGFEWGEGNQSFLEDDDYDEPPVPSLHASHLRELSDAEGTKKASKHRQRKAHKKDKASRRDTQSGADMRSSSPQLRDSDSDEARERERRKRRKEKRRHEALEADGASAARADPQKLQDGDDAERCRHKHVHAGMEHRDRRNSTDSPRN